jgi:hypothetical protein
MIQQGEMTIIMDKRGQPQTYRCVRIESGDAILRNVKTDGAGGTNKTVPVKECPYVKDGELITPEIPKYVRPKPKTKINITSTIKKNTDLQLSNSARYFIAEWLETALLNVVANAEANAIKRGDKRISAAHVFWLETNIAPEGYWPENEEYMK